jgi:endonuclease-3
MTKKERYQIVLDYLQTESPQTDTELHFASAFQLLVAVVLSAQCTDARVNIVTPDLFKEYPTPEAMADASEDSVFQYIHSVSYPNSKAKYLIGLSKMLIEQFEGKIPDSIEELTKLPGVGRKTANVIQALVFDKPALAVDTHVYRVSHRLALVPATANTPYKTEMELMKHIPTDKVAQSHFWLLYYGRYTCTAMRPKCKTCKLSNICRFYKEQEKRESWKKN